jgi:hypothetical protein
LRIPARDRLGRRAGARAAFPHCSGPTLVPGGRRHLRPTWVRGTRSRVAGDRARPATLCGVWRPADERRGHPGAKPEKRR